MLAGTTAVYGLVFGRRQVSIIVPGEFDLDMSN
jgi:hypothetical protein